MKRYIIPLIICLIVPAISFAKGQDLYVLQWSAITASAQDQVPDELATLNGGTSCGSSACVADQAISVGMADTISISCSTLDSDVTNASTAIDIDVAASQDGTNFDTTGEYYVEDFFSNLADNSQMTDNLTEGQNFIKLRLDNDDGSNTAGVKCRVTVNWKK